MSLYKLARGWIANQSQFFNFVMLLVGFGNCAEAMGEPSLSAPEGLTKAGAV